MASFDVAREATFRPQNKKHLHWFRHHDGTLAFPRGRSGKGVKGPRPLGSMCLHVLAENVNALPDKLLDECIRSLPEHLIWQLWKQLVPRNIPLRTWQIISSEIERARFEEARDRIANSDPDGQRDPVTIPMALHRYCHEISVQRCSLDVYVAPLATLTGCLTYLRLDRAAGLGPRELLPLAKLRCLAVLELIEDEEEPSASGVSDRVVRGWSETGPDDAFPELRVMRIAATPGAVSETSLRYVLPLPKLEIFQATLPTATWASAQRVAAGLGWEASRPGASLFLSYAKACLGGGGGVKVMDVDFEPPRLLYEAFDRGTQPLALVRGRCARDADPDHPGGSTGLDEAWRALLQGRFPSCAGEDNQRKGKDREGEGARRQDKSTQKQEEPDSQKEAGRQEEIKLRRLRYEGYLSNDDAFWFLSLLSQREYDHVNPPIQAQVAGVAVLRERFVSLRLRGPSSHEDPPEWPSIIFSRLKERRDQAAPAVPQRREETVQKAGGTKLPEERRETNLRPRKRQKLGDVFSSFGVL